MAYEMKASRMRMKRLVIMDTERTVEETIVC